MPEVRALPSPGVTRLQRYYDPVRLPPGPPPETASKPRTPTRRVSPDYPHCPSNVPCLIPRWTERVLASISSPSARPSPNLRRVGVHDFTFEACSGFTRVTARWIAQPPESGLCHEASARPVAQPDRSSATRFIDNFLGGTFLHWQHAPSGRTEKSGLKMSQIEIRFPLADVEDTIPKAFGILWVTSLTGACVLVARVTQNEG